METAYYGNPTANRISPAQVYPGSGGATLGLSGSAQSADAMMPTGNVAPVAGSAAAAPAGGVVPTPGGLAVSPLSYWIGLVLLVIGLMYSAQKSGDEGDYRNIKLSLYNILTITLTAVIGMVMLKPLGARIRGHKYLDGLGALLLAA